MGNIINIGDLVRSRQNTVVGLIKPAAETEYDDEIAQNHTSEPIKKIDDIMAITNYLKSEGRYRDNMLFILGINFGLRVSDLKELRFSHLINENFTFKDTFAVFEKKTRNTRKRKVNRYITINDAVMDAVTLYLQHKDNVTLSDYIFRSESNRGKNENAPLSTKSIDRILKGIIEDLNLNVKISTHSLRKTFCYHQMLMSNNDTRKLYLLQKMLNHSSVAQTLAYIGITSEEMENAYKELNLGIAKNNDVIKSNIYEINAS